MDSTESDLFSLKFQLQAVGSAITVTITVSNNKCAVVYLPHL